MLGFVLALLAQAAHVPWSPPAQAAWDGDGSQITARIGPTGEPISIVGDIALTVTLSSHKSKLRVSPLIAATRGIAFEVVDQSGRSVAPREPMAISPPEPPFDESKLIAVTASTPMNIDISERAANVFPRPGRYRVRAIVSLMNIKSAPVAYKKLRTNYMTVTVSD